MAPKIDWATISQDKMGSLYIRVLKKTQSPSKHNILTCRRTRFLRKTRVGDGALLEIFHHPKCHLNRGGASILTPLNVGKVTPIPNDTTVEKVTMLGEVATLKLTMTPLLWMQMSHSFFVRIQ